MVVHASILGTRRARRLAAALASAASLLLLSGCSNVRYNAELATLPYPDQLHTTESVDIQVFRNGESIQLINATTTNYENIRLWINQRFMREVESLPAGGRVRLPLGSFWDQWGGGPNPGGLFRRYAPTPVRLVEIQVDDSTPMVAAIAVPTQEEYDVLARRQEL